MRLSGGALLHHASARGLTYLSVLVLALATRTEVPSPGQDGDGTHVVARRLPAANGALGPAIIELRLDARGAEAAALVLVGNAGAAAPIWFDPSPGPPPELRTLVDFRATSTEGGVGVAYVLSGSREAVQASLGAERRQLEAAAAGNGPLPARVEQLALGAATESEAFAPDTLLRARSLYDAGEPARAVALLDAARPTAPASALADLDALASEAAFEAGHLRLARQIAERGLAVDAPRSAPATARLLRALVLAKVDGAQVSALPPERETLRELTASTPNAEERLRDAALDVRVAERIDRDFPSAQRLPGAVQALRDALAALGPSSLPSAVSSALCRAGAALDDADHRAGADLLDRGARLAESSGNVIDRVECQSDAGDVARRAGRLGEARLHAARMLELLGGANLPRYEIDAFYESSVLTALGGDYKGAYALQRRACAVLDALLDSETDLDAREALLASATGNYSFAAGLAIRAGMPVEAIAAGESGKARAFESVLRGAGEIEESAAGAWVIAGDAGARDDVGEIARRGARLAGTDAIVSYVFLGTGVSSALLGREEVPSVAIAVLTTEGTRATLVAYDDAFDRAFAELPLAVQRNDVRAAARAGKVLYDVLLAPIAPWLAGKRRVFVSPHLSLHKIPFASLHDGAHFLAERFTFARVPPLLVPGRTPEDEAPLFAHARRWLLVVDPERADLPRLAGLDAVADSVGGRTSAPAILRGQEATPERLLAGLSRADSFLYAGHARYERKRPLRSALLLTPSSAAIDEIDAWAVTRLRSAPALVLLLGCETARQYASRSTYSDETMGLPRAFLVAGARHVVGTLWPILDRDAENFVAALERFGDLDVVDAVGAAQACLARGECPTRGTAAWGALVVDTR